MIKSAVTISIVEQARKGPFVFHQDVATGCHQAALLGFDGVELFAPSGEAIREVPLKRLLHEYQLQLAAVGTGAGMVVHGLHLCDSDADRRGRAVEFIRSIIDAGAEFGAPAIIGSMQGRWDSVTPLPEARQRLQDGLEELGRHAKTRGVPLLYEPLNRYETNLATTLYDAIQLLQPVAAGNIRLLADLFHMNIEERDLAQAILDADAWIGHLHFVDSNRHAAGFGHLDFAHIAGALQKISWSGYASAEAFPLPDSESAARQTIKTFRNLFPR